MKLLRVKNHLFATCCIFFLVAGSLDVYAGSAWTESRSDFSSGEKNETVVKNNGTLALGYNLSSQANWTFLLEDGPPQRSKSELVYDGTDKVFLVFGGRDSEVMNDTRIYNPATNSWTTRSPLKPPKARDNYGLTYDENSSLFVLFSGGDNMGSRLNDTWTYNLTSDKWVKQSPASGPPGRLLHKLVYDKKEKCSIMFGGSEAGPRRNDTWVYYANNNTWMNMSPSKAPQELQRYGMVYDSANSVMVLFGGDNGSKNNNDTWVYNMSANSWTKKDPALSPPVREDYGLAYDENNKRTILFGGEGYALRNDTWTYDYTNNTWTNMSPGNSPPARKYHSLSYDPVSGCTLMFGGYYPAEYKALNDLWAYNYSKNCWTNLSSAWESIPPPRSGPVAYLPKNGTAILFGGWPANFYEPYNDTWAFNVTANEWTDLHPASAPSPRRKHLIGYDSVNDLVILFGGRTGTWGGLNDTWVYDPDTNKWTERTPAESPPADFTGYACAFDSDNGQMLYLISGKTWAYNASNNTWTDKKASPSPTGSVDWRMTYDSTNKVCVLFGGETNETWTYAPANNTWMNKTAAPAPPKRGRPAMAFDEQNGLTLVYGGADSDNLLNDTWAYDAAKGSWVQLKPSKTPSNRSDGEMFYSNDARSVYIIGGRGEGGVRTDVWNYSLDIHQAESGMYTSQPLDTKGNASFGRFRWDACVGSKVALKFQLRTADDSSALVNRTFIGPDGTAASYYTTSGQWVNAAHNASRWVQYRAYLSTTDLNDSPYLSNVTIDFNLAHRLNLTSPLGGENWTGVHNMTWNASDEDNDSLSFDIDLVNASGSRSLASKLQNGTINWSFDTTKVSSGTYRLRLSAKDNNTEIPLTVNATSPDFTIYHPPSTSLLGPAPNTTVTTWTVMLDWLTLDLDDHPIRHKVYLSKSNFSAVTLPEPVNITPKMNYTTSPLQDETRYYWSIIPNDGISDGALPPVRDFFVSIPNSAPVVSLISPENNSIVPSPNVTLKWTGNDADGNNITYTLYHSNASFDAGGLPAPVTVSNATCYDLSGLGDGASYYWAVWPGDWKHKGNLSEVRKYTVSIPNSAPAATLSSPSDNAIVTTTSIGLRWNGTDAEANEITYMLYFSGDPIDAVNLPAPLTTTYDTEYTATGLKDGKTYYWAVMARDWKDRGDLTPIWTFTVRLPVPNRPPSVNLTAPADSSVVKTSIVTLTWTGEDPDGDIITCSVFFSSVPFDTMHLPAPHGSTTNSSYIVRNLANGTVYYWTALPGDGQMNGTPPPVRNFRVVLRPDNRPPVATLVSPANGSTVSTMPIALCWTGTDQDGDALYYYVFLSTTAFGPGSLPSPFDLVGSPTCRVANLANQTAYYWTVVPNDGIENGTFPAVWTFKVILSAGPQANHPPRITTAPPEEARIGTAYVYTVMAVDEDNDPLAFSLLTMIEGMTMDPQGRLSWIPQPIQKGNQSVTVQVSDGRGGTAEQKFTISVSVGTGPNGPACSIASPVNGTKAAKELVVTGNAVGKYGKITKVEIRIDGGGWHHANGTENWSYSLDTTKLVNGRHEIQARAWEGTAISEPATVTVVVNNPGQSGKGFIPGMEAVLGLSAICSVVILLSRKRCSGE